MGGGTISKLTSPDDRASRIIFGDCGYVAIIGSCIFMDGVGLSIGLCIADFSRTEFFPVIEM